MLGQPLINPKEILMSKKMQDEIDAEVLRFSPPTDTAIGVMTRNEMVQLIRKTLTAGTVLGWAHGESFQRQRMQAKIDQLDYEMKCIQDRLKDAEMELLAAGK
jgi:hypothetical protein